MARSGAAVRQGDGGVLTRHLGFPEFINFLIDGSKLNGHADAKGRMLREHCNGIFLVREGKDDNAGQLFFGLYEGAVRDDDLASLGPYGLGVPRAPKPNATEPLPTLDTCLIEGDD